jgi:rhodanese-related sulfurtransferase
MQNKNEKIIFFAGAVLIVLVGVITFARHYLKTGDLEGKTGKTEIIEQYPKLTAQSLQEKIKNRENLIILDVRKPEDFSFEHLIDSFNIPAEELAMAEVPGDPTSSFIIVGSTSEESNGVANIMKKKGFEKVFVLTGTMAAWKTSGGQTVTWGDPTSFVNRSKVTFISAEDVKKYADDKRKFYLIDVRPNNKFSPHIPGAANIPLEELERRRDEIPINEEIVVYGETELDGFRSGIMLYDLNIMPVEVLRGGFSSWKDKGYPTE